MMVTVRFFGLASARFGRKRMVLELPADANIFRLLTHLQDEYSDVDPSFFRIMNFVVNGSRADRETPLKNGDEILIMSSIGGG